MLRLFVMYNSVLFALCWLTKLWNNVKTIAILSTIPFFFYHSLLFHSLLITSDSLQLLLLSYVPYIVFRYPRSELSTQNQPFLFIYLLIIFSHSIPVIKLGCGDFTMRFVILKLLLRCL